jgi:hypothetical protein
MLHGSVTHAALRASHVDLSLLVNNLVPYCVRSVEIAGLSGKILLRRGETWAIS